MAASTPIPTLDQVSAGGVAFREGAAGLEVALIAVGARRRWQLPKGLVEPDEPPEVTAVREVREEAGIETDLLAPVRTVTYWYVGTHRGRKVRFHKSVHFYLLRYRAGDVSRHDREVEEARWVPIDEALALLAFENERAVLAQAREMIEAG